MRKAGVVKRGMFMTTWTINSLYEATAGSIPIGNKRKAGWERTDSSDGLVMYSPMARCCQMQNLFGKTARGGFGRLK